MDKKWSEMSLDEKIEWHGQHPWVMRSYLILFAIIILLLEWAIFK